MTFEHGDEIDDERDQHFFSALTQARPSAVTEYTGELDEATIDALAALGFKSDEEPRGGGACLPVMRRARDNGWQRCNRCRSVVERISGCRPIPAEADPSSAIIAAQRGRHVAVEISTCGVYTGYKNSVSLSTCPYRRPFSLELILE